MNHLPRASRGRRPMRPLSTLLTLLPLYSGCAAVSGAVVGPVSTPISVFDHTHGTPTWAKVLVMPIAIPFGPFVGFCTGAIADVGYVQNGAYGVGQDLPFGAVFDPASPEWGRPPDPAGGKP